MNSGTFTRSLWIVSGVLLLAGAAMTAATLLKAGEVAARLKKRTGELRALYNLAAEVGRYEAAKRSLDARPVRPPQPLTSLVESSLPGCKAEERDSRKELAAGWLLRQKEISLNDVALGRVMEFVRKAEQQEPAWCLTKCVIRSTARPGGTGQVVLQMEALERVP